MMTELCPLHGEPIGPPPARNCPACRAAIDGSLKLMKTVRERTRDDPPDLDAALDELRDGDG